ncbi:MAG: archaetidylserine decarboxylase [Oleiphilaceae bacterium]|nr:archaetidylserine decarboxylase [Oleiphilaceae bacterium]
MQNELTHTKNVKTFSLIETLNFWLTNYIPRAASTRLMRRLSKIENPLFVKVTLKLWQFASDDMRLHEANQQHFKSLHECFTRTLRPETRPFPEDKTLITSPCDAVIGAHGKLKNLELLQIKGMPYSLNELTQGVIDLPPYRDGHYITLRLKSSMYHHMHAPIDCDTSSIHYISGDTWNVNPPTLRRIEKLFCKNERAVIELTPEDTHARIALVPIAAILVSSMRFSHLDFPLALQCKGANNIPFERHFTRGERLGNFEHGSTIVMLTSKHFTFMPDMEEGQIIRMGQALMRPNHFHAQPSTGQMS